MNISPMRGQLPYAWIVFITVAIFSCRTNGNRAESALQQSGSNREELEKVIRHFEKLGDDRKLKAAHYLIGQLPGQFHFKGAMVQNYKSTFEIMDSLSLRTKINYYSTWDSLQKRIDNERVYGLERVEDIDVIKAPFLIKNIENAFVAWDFPWAKHLSFEEFCEYLLPYKLRNEPPQDWRTFFIDRYRWVLDSMKNKNDVREACVLINNDLTRWFYITKLTCPFDLSFEDLMHTKSGRCAESTQLAAYAMRAMGIPVTLDYVALWGNRNFGHDWNAVYVQGRFIPFLGCEVNPGEYKLQFANVGSIKSKWPKVFRRTFAKQNNLLISKNAETNESIPLIFLDDRYQDITGEYALSFDVQIDLNDITSGVGYLCVFNNRKWQPVHWGTIENGKVTFSKMGADIIYLPAIVEDDDLIPVARPFLLTKEGDLHYINQNPESLVRTELERKYPVNHSNTIYKGSNYELVYWDSEWKSLGKQTATSKSLIYDNVPDGSLLWLKNLDEGIEERIFVLEKGKQVWW